MQASFVEYSINKQVATLTFYHPKGNSFPSSQLKNLEKEIRKLSANKEVKVIILQSQGEKVFCAGASFDELLTLKDASTATQFFMGFANVLLAMKECQKLIIGKIEGKAVGGGVGLVAGCDYAIATETASVKLSELSIGIGPFVIEPAITRKVGINTFSELTLHPKEWKTAIWCMEKGLYNKVVKTSEELVNEVNSFSENLCEYSIEALQELKNVFWKETSDWEKIMTERAAQSGKLVLQEYTQQKLKEFKEK